jgi:immune inhibitor A
MQKTRFFSGSELKRGINYPHFRMPSPSLYKKYIKTDELIKEGIHHSEFKEKGGIGREDFDILFKMIEIQHEAFKSFKEEFKPDKVSSTRHYSQINPVTGIKKILVLPVEFNEQNKRRSTSREYFVKHLLGQNVNSMADYFQEVSWRKINLQGEVRNWYTAINPYYAYVDDLTDSKMPKARDLVRETIQNAENNGKINFNEIDVIIVVFAGCGGNRKPSYQSDGNRYYNLFPHHYHLNFVDNDQERKVDYILMHELPENDLGGFCHEFAHVLGAPDLYYRPPQGPKTSAGVYCSVVGEWCLMARGDYNGEPHSVCGDQEESGNSPAHLSAWCKIHLGWAKPQNINGTPQLQNIPEVIESHKNIFKITIPNTNGNEYYLVENRQQKGFDKYLPSNGLLIWHINESNYLDQNPPNHDLKSLFLRLVQADGKNQLEIPITNIFPTNSQITAQEVLEGDPGDIYPGLTGNRTFDETSNPSSKTPEGGSSCVSIKSISDSGSVMKAVMGVSCLSDARSYFPNIMVIASYKNECLEKINEENCLISYQDGYRSGYRNGYQEALKEKKK